MAHRKDYRLSLAVFLWIQIWVAVPRLAEELALPGPLGQGYVWNRVWAALILPSLFCLITLGADLVRPSARLGHALLVLGIILDGLYLVHHIPPPSRLRILERWTAAAFALAAISRTLDGVPQNAAPGLEIIAALSFILIFAAGPGAALILSSAILTAALVATRQARRPPNT